MEAKQFEAALRDAETQLRRLRSLYDQWFSGIERIEPRSQKDDLDRLLVRMKAEPPRNTALRFRLNQLSQQYQTYSTYWKRITRQIEEGTYQRDLLRARRLHDGAASAGTTASAAERPDPAPAPAPAGDGAIDVGVAADGSPAPSRPPRAPAEISPLALPDEDGPPRPRSVVPPGAPARPRSRPPPAVSARPPQGTGSSAHEASLPEAQMRALFDRYVEARRANQERTDNVKMESLAKSVTEMLPKLRAKHPGKKIGFTVIVKDGKVALKPVMK